MYVTDRPITSIQPYFKNAKEHPEKQLKKIAASIIAFGFNQPIVVDAAGIIVVGHGRYEAAKRLGLEIVPVLEVALDEQKAKAYRLADNKLNESDWDMDIVIEELKGISLEMIDLTGFDSNLVLETNEDDPDLSVVSTPRSIIGDLYGLGSHRLICGDSQDPTIYQKLLEDNRARLIFTDPPYSVDYESSAGLSYESEKFGGTGGRIFNDDKTPEEALVFYKKVLEQLYTFSLEDVTLYWWFASRNADINMRAWAAQLWHMSQIVIWLKNSLIYSPGQLYHRIYEPCMVGLSQKTFSDYLDIWYQKRDSTNSYIHPTQKPVQLAERAIKRSSEKEDIVLDAFGGSGSTMIACEQLGRRARLIELDPKYCDAIVNRWVKYKSDPTITKNGQETQWVV